jgi:hypothetical protein
MRVAEASKSARRNIVRSQRQIWAVERFGVGDHGSQHERENNNDRESALNRVHKDPH